MSKPRKSQPKREGGHFQFFRIVSDLFLLFNKLGTNNDASWMKEDEEEEQDEGEDEDEEEEQDLLLTSKEPFKVIAKLILAKFTV